MYSLFELLLTVGEGDTAAIVDVNRSTAQRQGKYFHEQVSVSNNSAPQYEHVTVTASDGTTNSVIEGDKYVPAYNISYSYDADGNLLSDGRWNYTWDAKKWPDWHGDDFICSSRGKKEDGV